MIKILNVIAENRIFTIDIKYIHKIISLPALQSLPVFSSDVAGTLNYFGKIIPVYDLLMLIGLERSNRYTMDTMVLICVDGNKTIGLIIDDVKGQDVVDEHQVMGGNAVKQKDTYIKAIATLHDETVVFPDMDRILQKAISLV